MAGYSDNIRKVTPYVPGEQPEMVEGMIKINTNENPYPPSLRVKEILKEYEYDKLKLYPQPDCRLLNQAIADYHHLKIEQVFSGVGSDDVLAMAFLTFFNSDKPILFPDVTYSFYKVWAGLFRIPYKTMAVGHDLTINRAEYYGSNGGVVFANPNAPTSICESLEFVKDILEQNKEVIVIVDEAYIDFGGDSAISLIEEYDNLLVVRTFSKSRSMAGMRIGYAMGHKRLIEALNHVKHSYNSYTLNSVAMACGVESILDERYFNDCVERIIRTRERMKEELKALGFAFPDSKTNFIFAKHKTVSAKELFDYLLTKSIYVRYFDVEPIHEYLRITIGTDEEMDRFVEALKCYLESKLGLGIS